MARSTITEAAGTAVPSSTPGRLSVRLISPGFGSSGYYSPQVLENAATDRIWGKGCHVYFDHPTESEMFDRPERSVRDIAAVLDEDARWDGEGLVAEAKVIGPYKDLVTDPVFTEAVGMSIRASAEQEAGEAEGRKGTIVTRLVEGLSVDLVTKAGRGGKVLAVLESSRAEAREALSGETRDVLNIAVGANAWVVDFDPDTSTVIYRREWQDGDQYRSDLVRDGYTVTNGQATLAGAPEQVRQATSYLPVNAATSAAEGTGRVPATNPANIRIWGCDGPEAYIPLRRGTTDVPAPAGQSNATESKENAMATTQIEEAELGRLREDSQRVQTAESDRDTAVQERDTSRSELAEAHRQIDRATARDIVRAAATEAQVPVDDYQVAGIAADYPTTDGRLDVDKLTEAAKTAVAKLAEDAGAGRVHGFGATTSGAEGAVSEADARAFLYGEQKGA